MKRCSFYERTAYERRVRLGKRTEMFIGKMRVVLCGYIKIHIFGVSFNKFENHLKTKITTQPRGERKREAT